MKTLRKRAYKKKIEENIVNDAPKLFASFEPGDVSCQGDLLLIAIERLPTSAKPRSNRQLAEGSTQGSRHILMRGHLYDADPAEVRDLVRAATKCEVGLAYIGPVFVSPADPTADDLTHPEHGNQGFPADTVVAVVYQRSLDQEERERRVVD